MNKPDVLTGKQRVTIWEKFKKFHPNPKILSAGTEIEFAYMNMVLIVERDDTFKKTVKAVYEWGIEHCPHPNVSVNHFLFKRGCPLCWAELLKEVEG